MDDFQDLEGESGADEELRDMEERQSMSMDTSAPGLPEDPEAAAAALRPSTPAPGPAEGRSGEPQSADLTDAPREPPLSRDETGGFSSVLSEANAALGLPWVPKVRPKDIKEFLDATRLKFVGYQLPNDQTSLAGLPEPIHEGLRVLKQIALLKILLAAAPTSKAKTESVNIMADVLPEEMP
ncbi:hypothetical protein V5799_004979 [Amblyomma americanum]|uniref:Uncharacterized protein n=1 Tax=Amblyomma americanum TaxID=6943 RepID=A0AAQ4D4J5_AMBAM